MLESDVYKDSVKADIAEARKLNFSSVPTFVFNNKHTISGALNSVWDEEKKFQKLELKGESKGDDSCTDGVCNV